MATSKKIEKHAISLNDNWLVVWTPLKNISQLGLLFPKYGKIKNVPNHQPDKCCYDHHGLVLILTLTITALDCDCRQYHDWCIVVGSLVVKCVPSYKMPISHHMFLVSWWRLIGRPKTIQVSMSTSEHLYCCWFYSLLCPCRISWKSL